MPAEQESQSEAVEDSAIEKYLRDYYGQKHVLWLGDGIEGDDTDGHIDDLARFIDERTIAIGIETNKRDPNYAILQKARRALEKAAIRTAVRSRSSSCRCRSRSPTKASACRRPT